MGGWTPMPKKLRPASSKMAVAKFAAEMTIIGLMTFGMICFTIILALLKPSARPASTNVASLNDSICPLATRATSTHIVKPTAMKTCTTPLPNAKVIAMTISNVGNDHTTFISHITTSSTTPRKKPPTPPTSKPTTTLINTAMKPTDRLILVPLLKADRNN